MLFSIFDEIVNDWFDTLNKTTKKSQPKKKRKYTKRTFKEKDCEVYYDPSFLFKANMPGEYVNYEEI